MLLADPYPLTMLQGYLRRGMRDTAVFEFFVRKRPPGYDCLVAAGLEFLESAQFGSEELA